MNNAIIYAICGVLIMAIGFALGMWVEKKTKEKEESDMTVKELVREITEKELYLKVINRKREETENRIKELQAELEILEG